MEKRTFSRKYRTGILKLIKVRIEGEFLQPVIRSKKKKKIHIIIVPASARIEIQFI